MYRKIAIVADGYKDKRQNRRDRCVNWMSDGIETRIICGYMDLWKGWFHYTFTYMDIYINVDDVHVVLKALLRYCFVVPYFKLGYVYVE